MIEDPKNAHIHKFIGDSNFDLVLGDPLEVASSLIAWKYNLPLAHNARWTLNGDAGQSEGLKIINIFALKTCGCESGLMIFYIFEPHQA